MFGQRIRFMLSAALLGLTAVTVSANERRFSFTDEATIHAPGEIEIEQYITWKRDKNDVDSSYDRLDLKSEFEFGVTENFQLAFTSVSKYQDGDSVTNDGLEFRTVGVEGVYQLADPTEEEIGYAIYLEFAAGEEKLKGEGKLLVQKNVEDWVFAYNLVLEGEWEGEDYNDEKGEVKNLFGATYQVTPRFSAGAEAIIEMEAEDFESFDDPVVYVGPSFSYRESGWFVTIAPTFQVTDEMGASNFLTRFIIGIDID